MGELCERNTHSTRSRKRDLEMSEYNLKDKGEQRPGSANAARKVPTNSKA
jgi:hypothetical protein